MNKTTQLDGLPETTVALANAAEQFVAAYADGNVGTMLDYFEDIFKDALSAIAADRNKREGEPPPEGWRERLREMQDASYTYSQHPELARVIFDSVIDALDELEPAAPVSAGLSDEDVDCFLKELSKMAEEDGGIVYGLPTFNAEFVAKAAVMLRALSARLLPGGLTPMLLANAAFCIDDTEGFVSKDKRQAISMKLCAIADELQARKKAAIAAAPTTNSDLERHKKEPGQQEEE